MQRAILVLLLTTVMAGGATGLNTAQMDHDPGSYEDPSLGTLLTVKQSGNESYYFQLIKSVRDQYAEDLGYSSDILNEFVKDNITNREAMTATISVMILTTQTNDVFDQAESPEEYVRFHRYMQYALKYMKEYLWNMAKFYETGNNEYAVQAQDNFNQSIFYYEKSIEEYNSIQLPASGN